MFSKIRLSAYRGTRSPSLAVLLTVFYTAASFLLVAVATAALYYGLASNLKELSQQILFDELNVCRTLVHAHSGDFHALREEVEVGSAVRRYRKFYMRVLDESGVALFTTPGMDSQLPAPVIARKGVSYPGRMFSLQSLTGVPYRVIVGAVRRGFPANEVWTIQIAVDLTQEREVLGRHRIWVWSVLAAALIFCPWIGFLVARRATGPLRDVAQTAQRIGSTTLYERIRPEGFPAEIAILAETFNAMLERLEGSFGRLSRFSADIAHELRTPVNNIRGQAEVALVRSRSTDEYRDVLVSCLEESVRLSELIDSLLFLARSESPGDHLSRAPVDIGQLLSDLRDYYDAAAAENGVDLTLTINGPIVCNADRVLLQRAVGNLVSNALAHTASGQAIGIAAERNGTGVHINVRDTGAGITPEALPRIFDRFYRGDPARARQSGGAGLGLAIVQQIVSLHGGTIDVESHAGKGTSVTVHLPQAVKYLEPRHPNGAENESAEK